MKKIILIITLIFTTSLFAQYNLEFSQVRNIHLASNQTATVPDGKVWKIENGTSSGSPNILLEFSPDPDFGINFNASHPAYNLQTNVVWLRAGAKIVTANSSASYSILEFNLVSVSSSGGGGSGDSGSGGSGSGSSSGVSFNNNAGVPDDDFTDPNGNTYGTINLNGMVWTTSNYEGTTYSDGTPIPYISGWDEWKSATTGAYTYWIQDESLGYGKIYNLHAIRGRHDDDNTTPNKKFAPDGWHVPSKNEIDYIKNLYSNSINANSFYLKSATGWAGGANGTNTSGLDIKPYGAVPNYHPDSPNYGFTTDDAINNVYSDIGGYTHIWTDTPHESNAMRLQYQMYISLDGADMEYAAYSFTPFLEGLDPGGGSENNYFNEGAYVRLIKDY